MIFILLYLGSDLGQLRGWHTAQLAAVANHHPGRTLPDHVADEHLPLHGHELQLCQYRGNKSDVYRYTEINQSLIRVHNMVEYRNLFFSAYTIKFLVILLFSTIQKHLQIIEKEPSIIEEYDPYRSWHGSQYGSRYSLHGRDAHKGYTSGGSTIHSNRSDRY